MTYLWEWMTHIVPLGVGHLLLGVGDLPLGVETIFDIGTERCLAKAPLR